MDISCKSYFSSHFQHQEINIFYSPSIYKASSASPITLFYLLSSSSTLKMPGLDWERLHHKNISPF